MKSGDFKPEGEGNNALKKRGGDSQPRRGATENKGRKSCAGTLVASCGLLISLFWILNFSMGIFELPDNLPIVGNLDEAFFTMVFLACLSYLGVEIPFINSRFNSRNGK